MYIKVFIICFDQSLLQIQPHKKTLHFKNKNLVLNLWEQYFFPDLQRNMKALEAIVEKFPKLMFGFPTWQFLPPRWSPLFRDVEDNFNIAVDFVKSTLDVAIQKLESKGIGN